MPENLSMALRHEWWGKWWLPDAPETAFGGMAVFDPNGGVTLRLNGGFDHMVFDERAPGVRAFLGETRHFPVVLGKAQGKPITLLDCNVSSSSGSLFNDEPWDQTLTATTLLQGCHLADASASEFVAIETVIENLPQWSPASSISGLGKFSANGGEELPTATYEIGPVDAQEALVDGNRFVLDYTYSIPNLKATLTRHEVRLYDEPAIKIEFEQPLSAEESLTAASPLRDLITLSMGRPCGIVSQRVFITPVPGRYPDDHPNSKRRSAVACFTRQPFNTRPEGEPVPQHEVIFTLKEIPFAEIIPRWLRAHETFRAASNLILGLQYNTEQFLETRTITAVAAAESFHRALDPVAPIPDADFEGLRKAVVSAAPAQYRSLVRERFQRNEPSLKTRLLELLDRLDPDIVDLLVPDRETWAKRARDSRNTLAHEGSRGDSNVLELHAVAEVTAAVVMLNLLRELGVPDDKVREKMSQNSLLMRATRLSKKYLRAASAKESA